jgi:hypothetical protein
MLFRYSLLCGAAFDAVDAVKLKIHIINNIYSLLRRAKRKALPILKLAGAQTLRNDALTAGCIPWTLS